MNSKSLIRLLKQQGLYVFISVVVYGVFWATGQSSHFSTIIVYSLCIGNCISLPLERLGYLYARRPFPYNWLIFLGLLSILSLPVYAVTTVIVWLMALPDPQPLWTLLSTGWKFPVLVTLVFSTLSFMYNLTKERLEQRNVELQKSIEKGTAKLEMQDRELERAREIQESLLPKSIPQVPGFEVAAAWHPARIVGGDYYDVLRMGDGRLMVCIADVVGKGVSAALLMANVQATVRAFAHDSISPAWLCSRVNEVLRSNIASDKFVTFFTGIIDVGARTFQYCNAGHPYPVLMSFGSVRQLDKSGAVLGVFPDWKYEDSVIDLNPGDRLLLFTDGITEAEEANGHEFGVEGITGFAKANPAGSASRLTNLLLERVTEFCGGQFQDDATLLVIAAE